MARCLHLAKLGQGNVAPNPMVGSVVVHNNVIIGEGYHQKYGEAHAEVNAINAVKEQSLLKDSTIYVNLEPCAHFGKTPPCADLIIEKGIKKAVIGCIDPYSEVAGKGIEKLKNAGISVTLNILQAESERINSRFFTFHAEKRPYVILKWAQSANGMIDIARGAAEKGIHWITQPATQSLVHQWRAEEAGILVGRKTVENDNPSLTCRAYRGTNPIRIVIDQMAKLAPENYNISNGEATTYIISDQEKKSVDGVQYLTVAPFDVKTILKKLYDLNVQSLIIEGGKFTLQQFIDVGYWDETRIIEGIGSIENGVTAPQIQGKLTQRHGFGEDTVSIYHR